MCVQDDMLLSAFVLYGIPGYEDQERWTLSV